MSDNAFGSAEKMLAAIPGYGDQARIAARTNQVHDMWCDIVDDVFLKHTNSVYVLSEKSGKRLIAYMDESIYAAELNARRELIKLQFNRRYDEDIKTFDIFVSKGKFKKNHPFLPKTQKTEQVLERYELTPEDTAAIDEMVAGIDSAALRAHVRAAMIANFSKNHGEMKNKS